MARKQEFYETVEPSLQKAGGWGTGGLVTRSEDWAWSSFRHYLSGQAGPVEIESQWIARKLGAEWDLPYGEGASTRRKSPPKRSLDGPPSRVGVRFD